MTASVARGVFRGPAGDDSGRTASGREDWQAAAAAVLRKAGRLGPDEPDDLVWTRLATRTLDDLTLLPLGTPADQAPTSVPLVDPGMPGRLPVTRGRRPAPGAWDVRVAADGRGDPASANRRVLEELRGGATSLWLRLPDDLSGSRLDAVLDRVLDGVLVNLAPVVLDCPEDPVGAARALVGWLRRHGCTPAAGTSLGADPYGQLLRAGSPAGEPAESAVRSDVGTLAELATTHAVGALVVDATLAHDRGASDAQELGYSLAAGAAYLRLLTEHGLDVEVALGLVGFRFAVTDEQIPSIAKLRAARRTWARLAELCGAAAPARDQVQHAVTSRPMLTRYNPWVNLPRTTVAAFAAAAGGADAVTVLPYDAAIGEPEPSARRWARNISALLVAESHLARVQDPAGGSYTVERLTDDLAGAAWAELDRIERAGGVPAVLADGSLVGGFAETAARRRRDVATRRRPVTGVSEFPDAAERAPLPRPPHRPGDWDVVGWAADFEALRDRPGGSVFLATLGPVADHGARAGFVENLCAAGGLATTNPGPLHTVDDVLSRYDGRPVVCLVGSDAAYAAWGPALVAALRYAGARRVVLAGRPGPGTVPADLVDDSVAVGDDVVAFLRRTREASR